MGGKGNHHALISGLSIRKRDLSTTTVVGKRGTPGQLTGRLLRYWSGSVQTNNDQLAGGKNIGYQGGTIRGKNILT